MLEHKNKKTTPASRIPRPSIPNSLNLPNLPDSTNILQTLYGIKIQALGDGSIENNVKITEYKTKQDKNDRIRLSIKSKC